MKMKKLYKNPEINITSYEIANIMLISGVVDTKTASEKAVEALNLFGADTTIEIDYEI
jgi:hypothetical protein